MCFVGGGWMYVGWWLVKVRVCWKTEGFLWKLSDSCYQHALHEVDAYVWGWRNATRTCSCDSRRCTRGLGWWRDVMYVICRMFAFFELWQCFDQGSSAFFACLLTGNRLSFLATVFNGAFAFNGDLSDWNVAKVTTMRISKSIRIWENVLTWRELMLLWLEGSVRG